MYHQRRVASIAVFIVMLLSLLFFLSQQVSVLNQFFCGDCYCLFAGKPRSYRICADPCRSEACPRTASSNSANISTRLGNPSISPRLCTARLPIQLARCTAWATLWFFQQGADQADGKPVTGTYRIDHRLHRHASNETFIPPGSVIRAVRPELDRHNVSTLVEVKTPQCQRGLQNRSANALRSNPAAPNGRGRRGG